MPRGHQLPASLSLLGKAVGGGGEEGPGCIVLDFMSPAPRQLLIYFGDRVLLSCLAALLWASPASASRAAGLPGEHRRARLRLGPPVVPSDRRQGSAPASPSWSSLLAGLCCPALGMGQT